MYNRVSHWSIPPCLSRESQALRLSQAQLEEGGIMPHRHVTGVLGGVSQEKGAISTTTFSLRRRLVQPFSRERKPALCVLDGNGGPGSHEGRLQHRHPHLNCSLGGRVWTESPQVSVEPEQVPAQLRGPTLSAGILPERPIRGQRWRNVIQWGLVSTSCNLEGPLCPQVGSRRPRLPV